MEQALSGIYPGDDDGKNGKVSNEGRKLRNI
jgi:hypothetical protein